MKETIIISAIIGLLAGVVGAWFQSLFRMREKKFELLFNLRRETYGTLHQITFPKDSVGQARYDWQIDGVEGGEQCFRRSFDEWFKTLKEFYETTSWVLDATVCDELKRLYEIAEKIEIKFWSQMYEHIAIDATEIDNLWLSLIEAGKKVRRAIQEDMKMTGLYRWL